MTHPGQPIATTYVEIRPAPGSKENLKQEVIAAATPAGAAAGDALGKGLGEGAKKGRTATEEQLSQLDARMLRSQAVAETIGKGVGRATVRIGQLAGAGLAVTGAAGLVQIRNSQTALAALESSIKSTGDQAGISEQQMLRLADSVEGYSGQAADSIVAAEAQLLAYKRVTDQLGAGNDVFTRATKATADMAERMGGAAVDKARILGRALEDPVHGLSSLITAGVDFDAQQVKTITRLEQTGQHLEAQKVILDQVEKTVGGAAKAYGQTLPGAIDRARNSFEEHAAGLLKFADDHRVLSGAVVTTAGSLYIAVKAVKTYREIRDTLFAGAGRRIATNLAEAKSIDAIAAAEGRAAAGAGARGAGTVAGTAGRTGILGTLGAGVATVGGGSLAVGSGVVAAGLASLATAAAAVHSIGTVKTNQAVEQLHRQLEKAGADQRDLAQYELSLRDKLLGFDKDKLQAGRELLAKLTEQQRYTVDTNQLADRTTLALRTHLAQAQQAYTAATAARRDPRTLDTSAGVFGGAFEALPSRISGDPASAREAVDAANKRVRDAERALAEAGGGGRTASRSQIAAAEATVLARQDAVHKRGGNAQAEQLRLEAAEAHLSELRSKGGANADKIREAEERLTEARKNAKDATQKLHEAEKPKALGAEDVLKRITAQRTNADTLVADADLLIARGVKSSTLTALQAVEKEAPGSFDKLAKTMTPALAKALNAQQAALSKAQFQFYDAPRVAALHAAEAAIKADKDGLYARIAKASSDAYQNALRQGRFSDDDIGTGSPPSRLPDPNEHGPGGTAKVTTTVRQYNITGPWVANDPAQMRGQLEKLDRLDSLR